jgi:hypothetical protein
MISKIAIRWRAAAFLLFSAVFDGGSAAAAINPADPGLADAEAFLRKGIPNNGASALCVECHTENPTPGYGTHFVMNALTGELRLTHSGGGWDKAAWDIREGGEFFKLAPWDPAEGGNGGSSKYGDTDTWETVVFSGNDVVLLGAERGRQEPDALQFINLELICESCHNIRVNIEGGRHLLARLVNNEEVVGERIQGSAADLCVGCHGFLYQDDGGIANSLNRNWNDPRGVNLISGLKRGNNEVHSIAGLPYARNHHVMTGDVIVAELADAGLLLRDVRTLDAGSVSAPIRTDSKVGAMPLRDTAVLPIVLPANREFLHCVVCHAPGHGGDPTTGASILVGTELSGSDSGMGIDRISDGRTWMNFRDRFLCGKCHLLPGER